MEIPHDLSMPGIPQSNGYIERQVQDVLRGSRQAIEQSGLPHTFWMMAAAHYCMDENIRTDIGDSRWQKRHGKHWMGLTLPFGASVAYYPAETTQIRKKTNVHSAAARLVPGIFLGHELTQIVYGKAVTLCTDSSICRIGS